jgi:flagellar hook-associated protein 3 FlgL
MRITSGSYYNNIYGENNKLNRQLFDVNKQISSGLKIQYAHEDPTIFIDTLRLDDELTTLGQVKNSAQNAYKFSTQTDTTIGDIVKTLESMKTKLINSASDTQSNASRQAIAQDLRGLQSHLLVLANTSIGGQYLFSGTALSVKPIDENYNYKGNDKTLEAFLGSGVKQQYNVTGTQLFTGEESIINRKVTTNIAQMSLTDLYPGTMQSGQLSNTFSKETYITSDSTIRDLMGDTDNELNNDPLKKSHFYLQGTRHDGSTFKTHIPMNSDETVNDLMQKIALQYDPYLTNPDLVNVSINAHGQIEIEDKLSGSSKLDFHMVGAIDFDETNAGDAADILDVILYAATTGEIDNLKTGTTDFTDVISGSNQLYLKEFVKSGLTPTSVGATIEGLVYDQFNFTKDGAKLLSNTSQILKGTNEYATAADKLVDASGSNNVNGRILELKGTNINGGAYDITINLGTPSSFTDNIGANTYDIYGTAFDDTLGVTTGVKESVEGIASNANEVSYRQLMDIVNMAVTNALPTIANDPVSYDAAIATANSKGNVSLTSDGKLTFEDLVHTTTNAGMALYDQTSSSFLPPLVSGNALSFQTNNTLTISDPKKNFFAEIEEMIKSVEEGKMQADGEDDRDPRNIGIQNSIQKIDDLTDHISRLQTQAGSYSQVLQSSSDRSDLLIISTKTLQSDVIDTDVAEATLRMQQLSLNYQALLSNISKVSKLSLVNYL